MSKLIYAVILAVTSVVCLCSCNKDTSSFLKRNTDKLSFSYSESTATFTVRSTGSWSISIPEGSEWIKVSPEKGVGDGSTYQTVQVTCVDNTGEAREGVIYLNGSGQADVPITISQANGVFEWKEYGNGSKFSLDDLLIKGSPSTASIKIPYVKATGKETVKPTVMLSGKGATGLSVKTDALTLQAGDADLIIPIVGTPTEQGQVNIDVKIGGVSFGSVSTITGIGQVLIDQSFAKFMWGGDCIANKDGITTTMPTASMTISDPTTSCSVGTNGANGSGVTSTIKNSNPGFYKAIGMESWSGVRNYMRPGYIQLGSASSTGSEFGSLISPALNLPSGNFDLLISFKLGIYNQPAPHELVVGLITGNPTGITTDNYTSITSENIIPVNFSAQQWVEFTCIVKNATRTSSLVITLPESIANAGTVGGARIYVDDIKVSY